MRSRTDEEEYLGGRTAEKEADSLVKHYSLLSNMRPRGQWWYWGNVETSGVPGGTFSVGCLSTGT